MTASREAFALRVNQRFFYGWLMTAVGAIGIFASGAGQSFIFGVFLTPLGQDLQLSQTSLTSAYAVATLMAAFGLPYVGRLIDRYGVRYVILRVGFLLGLAAFGFSLVDNLFLLTLGFMALRFLGQGSLMMNCNNLVVQWFNRRRGLALSLTGLGFSLSIMFYPPLAQWLLEQVGWREAWLWIGLLTWVLILPPAWWLIQDKPEAIGLVPDGVRAANPADGERPVAANSDAHLGLDLGEAMRTSAFWIIAAGMFTLAMLVTTLFFYQVAVFESHGLSARLAANLFPLTAITMMVFMPLQGYLVDRFPTPVIFAWTLSLLSASMVLIVFVDDLTTAVIYSVVFGLNNAALHSVYAYVWPRYFGRKHLGSIQGAATTVGVVGASLGPLPFGIAYDLVGSYTGTLLAFAVQPLLCAVLVLFVNPPNLSPSKELSS